MVAWLGSWGGIEKFRDRLRRVKAPSLQHRQQGGGQVWLGQAPGLVD